MSFPIFTLTGTFIWQIITQSLNTTMTCVNSGKSLLTKLNFPRESLLIHAFYTTMFNVAIMFVITCIMIAFLGWKPTTSFVFFPLVILDLALIGTSLGLLFLVFFSLIADFSKLLTIGLQLLMYVSAVIFPKPPEKTVAYYVFNLNPLTHVVSFSRSIFVGVPLENSLGFIIVSISAFVLFIVGLIAYKIVMPIIIERMGS